MYEEVPITKTLSKNEQDCAHGGVGILINNNNKVFHMVCKDRGEDELTVKTIGVGDNAKCLALTVGTIQ